MPENGRRYDLEDRLIDFAVRMVEIAEKLPRTRPGLHISGQLVSSGTSPAPNYGEAHAAESTADFIHKMKVCLKELRETRIWLIIIKKCSMVKPVSLLDADIDEVNQLIATFVASIRTAQRNRPKK